MPNAQFAVLLILEQPLALERAKRNWNRLQPLERPKGYWNARSAFPLTLKCVNFVNFVNFWKEKSHRFRDGIFLFIRSRIYSLVEESCEVPSDEDSALAES